MLLAHSGSVWVGRRIIMGHPTEKSVGAVNLPFYGETKRAFCVLDLLYPFFTFFLLSPSNLVLRNPVRVPNDYKRRRG